MADRIQLEEIRTESLPSLRDLLFENDFSTRQVIAEGLAGCYPVRQRDESSARLELYKSKESAMFRTRLRIAEPMVTSVITPVIFPE
jgi:hypothetical protein